MISLAHINRFPVKSMGGETLESTLLSPGHALPGDREWAVLHADALRHLDHGALTKWLPKAAFLRGAAAPSLQAITGGWHDGLLCLTHPGGGTITISPETDSEKFVSWVAPFWPSDKPAPSRLIRGPQPLTDNRKPLISLLSLNSLVALEQAAGMPLGMDRWRANLWLSGMEPWAERDLVGDHIAIGPVRLRVVAPINRCAATNVDTRTGQIDIDMPALLNKINLDQAFGIFAEVTSGGDIAVNDGISL